MGWAISDDVSWTLQHQQTSWKSSLYAARVDHDDVQVMKNNSIIIKFLLSLVEIVEIVTDDYKYESTQSRLAKLVHITYRMVQQKEST